MKNDPAQAAFTSRFIIRALDRSKHIDYGIAFAVGAWPILYAYFIGAHRTIGGAHRSIGEYVGYWDSPNWLSLAILLPLLLFGFRFVLARIVPVGTPWPPPLLPPIVDLLREESAKARVYEALRRRVVSRWNVVVPLAVAVLVHIVDALALYFGISSTGLSWANMYKDKVTTGIGWAENMVLLLSAGIAQFSVVFLGMLSIAIFFQHNFFFLGNIYQRRWVPVGEEARFFQINPKDVNRCFGFRIANVAFNAQVWALMVAGAAMFLSRYASSIGRAGQVTELLHWPPTLPELSFPLPSQWAMSLSWLVALAVVAMPAMVKLLPRIPGRGAERVELSISNYLHEFFSNEAWPKDKTGRDESDLLVAARFAWNSFWPTGDNRAGVLFFFAYWIFFVTLLPAPLDNSVALVISLVFFAVLAYLARLGTFAALRHSLRYVDELLVAKGVEVEQQLESADPRSDRIRDLGVFISYRRRDSAPYARSLHERLLDEFRPERIFIDIADIAPGENFVHRIDRALDAVDAVIVLIGEKWLTVADDQSRPRIEDPADMVHVEIATALRRNKRVFPVLVGGAKMPAGSELPSPLKGLAQLNAIEITDTRWAYDVGCLIDAVKARS
ncbi:MAG TPA: toll/interleukin-1 receptor domain-containing protein [Candidatus Binatia bacterium]|nr:toll/interleukin-1 receptor domain-containing protein [Candidatus Binatia bacterium]